MRVAKAIEQKLTAALKPDHLEIIDDSGRHAGHGGARPEGESHFQIVVVSAAFEGIGRVQRQRMVYDLLQQEFDEGLHALQLKTLTPKEFEG